MSEVPTFICRARGIESSVAYACSDACACQNRKDRIIGLLPSSTAVPNC